MPGFPATDTVVLMVGDLEAGGGRSELAELLGAERWAALERTLLVRALSWAGEVAPGRVQVAFSPAAAERPVRALAGDGVDLFPQAGATDAERLADAAQRAFALAGGPVLIAWPRLATWRAEHAAAALDDLADGCDVSIGPVSHGGFYLLALNRPAPPLFTLPEAAWRSPQAMGEMLALAHRTGLSAGLLRVERGLHRPADVWAALADPLLDPELGAILHGA